MINIELLERDLLRDEGYRCRPYYCSAGHPTIGVGHMMTAEELADGGMEQTWSRERIFKTLRQDIHMALRGCEMIFGRTRYLSFSEARQRALANMCFQLGMGRLSGFQRMIAAIFADDWGTAHKEALDSKWARQTPDRARRVAAMLLEG